MIDFEAHMDAALTRLSPPMEGRDDWDDVLRRGRARRRPLAASFVGVLALATILTVTPFGQAFAGGALHRLVTWTDQAPGGPASSTDRDALRKANAKAAAPIPADTKLGLLGSGMLDGVTFELLGFRDRGSLCLRLRTSLGQDNHIVKAPATCVFEQLLVDLGKPLAVFSAADPFPRRAKPGLQALYGLAADDVAAIELVSEGGVHRVPVENNAFLFLYRGEAPSLPRTRLVYRSDVPSRANALDAADHRLGSVKIMSLKRGYPGAPPASALPGPSVVGHPIASPRVGWLDRGEQRGDPYDWTMPDGTRPRGVPPMRIITPNPATSMRVLVGRMSSPPAYCTMNVWPLAPSAPGYMCDPIGGPSVTITMGTSTSVFDAQFPVYYGLVPDEVRSLKLILANGADEQVPIVDNVFAFQTSGAEPAKLVGYDSDGQVVVIRIVSF